MIWQREGADSPIQLKELGIAGGLEGAAKFDGWGKTRSRVSELPSVIYVTGEGNAMGVSRISQYNTRQITYKESTPNSNQRKEWRAEDKKREERTHS